MPKEFPLESTGFHPFGELIGLNFSQLENGHSRCALQVTDKLLNPNRVLHGGVIYSLADTGMAGALHMELNEDESCATVEISIVYLAAVTAGTLTCDTRLVRRSKRIAILESEVENDGRLVAKALGTYSVIKARGD
ncbi:MAG TPA: PaaI family thioesterase [Dehalococcoidia bacterium]|nr:PaaI family thioesterase [Dehalococcoidia bacterium]